VRNLFRTLMLSFAILLFNSTEGWGLSQCPKSKPTYLWNNCVGTGRLGDTGIYVGEFRKGEFHGQGTMKYKDGSKYVGDWKNYEWHGLGSLTLPEGGSYVGEYKNMKMHGRGTFTYSDGTKYVGEFKDNKYNGQGTLTDASGYIYVGEFKDGMSNGYGTTTFASGTKHVGENKDGAWNGQGTFTLTDGTKYVGEFKDNKYNGQGTFFQGREGDFAGSKYVGEFKDGMFNGQGTHTFATGSKYVGEFKDNFFNGQGTLTAANGAKYVGGLKHGEFYGQGTWTAANGVKYVGEWKGMEFGQGIYIYADGSKVKGGWKDVDIYTQNVFPPPVPQKKITSNSPTEPKPQPPSQLGTSGSGFFVSRMGHVVTNAHVVDGCSRLTVGDSANKQTPAEVISTDARIDLALLKLSSLKMASSETKALIRKLGIKLVPLAADGLLRSEDVELGEQVLVAGYPYGDIFSNTIKVTGGMVSATRGMGDDSGQFQMDAAVQPGNSGGPIYDEHGNIVGVVVSQLNKLNVAKAIGSLPENVNFGIKASTVRQFLTASGLPSKWSARTNVMSNKELAKIAEKQALMVMCVQ
jgi:hypothetical protein